MKILHSLKPASPLVRALLVLLLALLLPAGWGAYTWFSLPRYACAGQWLTADQIAAKRGIAAEMMPLLRQYRSLDPAAVCSIPQDKLERAISRVESPKPDRPDEALAWRMLAWQDENGDIPPGGLVRAKEQMDEMLAAAAVPAAPQAAGIDSSSWTWLGPGNVGGRIRALVIHPDSPNTMWAGSVSGGIWKSTDGGATWSLQTDFLTNMAVSTLVMDPTDPDVIYAGTGEGFYNYDGIRGAGVFKTTDGGGTWTQLAATNTSNWQYVNRLAISPSNHLVLLAATNSGIWRSADGGSTWSQRTFIRALDIDFDPNDGSKAVASGGSGEGWYSTDGGLAWDSAAWDSLGVAGRIELAYAPSSPGTVYASVNIDNGEIWKSTNSGANYTQVSVNTNYNYLGAQGWYDNIIWVDPTNANNLIVGGIDLWRSTDGGINLTQISQWWDTASAHADHHIILQHPDFDGSTNRTVFFGNDGGLYKTADYATVSMGSGWQELNNNLGITQFYGGAGNPQTGSIVGGTQDNGTLIYKPANGTEGWTSMFGGDGGYNAFKPSASDTYVYGEYVYGCVHRSGDGGNSSAYICGFRSDGNWKTAPYLIEDSYQAFEEGWRSVNFIAPFVLDPNNPDRLLVGGRSLWRTNNAETANTNSTGPSWAAIKAPINTDPGDSDYNISAIVVAQGNADIIWVGHNNGHVYKTGNGTAASPTWTRMDLNDPDLPNRYVTRIAIDPNNHNKVYVAFGGFGHYADPTRRSDNLWRTTDGGATWADITGSGLTGLPDVPIRTVTVHPLIGTRLYVGTEIGIFASQDGGANWHIPLTPPYHDGPTNTAVDELFWMDTTLVAATHGRGMFAAETYHFSFFVYTPLIMK